MPPFPALRAGATVPLSAAPEDEPRGLYAGGIGWIDSNGSADLAIALRSIFQYGDDIIFRAGAGIVGESKPDFEYIETVNKMKTMLNYLVMA